MRVPGIVFRSARSIQRNLCLTFQPYSPVSERRKSMVTRLCLLLAFLSNAASAADTLVINANVITVDQNHPSAQAFAFDNGRFTAVGTKGTNGTDP
jgi:hypothetical protein